jgi:uncharacterized membrane protein YkvA (DUF1232 family)
MGLLEAGRVWARRIKRDAMTLWFARKHPRTPWHAKALGVFVVAYALSPIDLIPDFIPVLGYLDDVILLPALIWLAVRLLPQDVLAECRAQAEQWLRESRAKPRSRAGAALIVGLWLVLGLVLAWWVYQAGPAWRKG